MENACKPFIEEKHYAYSRADIKNDGKPELRKIDCPAKKGLGADGGSGDGGIILEMAPPPYPDLGKRAKDVFNKGYHFGLIKLDCRTASSSGVEFSTGGVSNQESGKVSGSLETKYTVKEYGITFSEKWNTDNTLGTEISVKDQGLQGLKLSADCNFSPQSGYKSARVKSAFQNERVALNADADLDTNGPIVGASAVVGYQGWLAGYQGAFDTQKSKLSKSNFALGFSTADFVLHTSVGTPENGDESDESNANKDDNKDENKDDNNDNDNNENNENSEDGQEFSGSIYQKINPKLESAIMLSWSSGSNNTKFGIGAKYDLDQDASIRAKVNNSSQIGLGYQQRLRDGVTLTLSALIDGKNFNNGGHKIGLALELEA